MPTALLTIAQKQVLFAELLVRTQELMASTLPAQEKLELLCHLLHNDVPYYNWVGFYIVDVQASRELVLGPFAGEPTDHIRIPFGQGICGQAAERLETFTIQDVSLETNYLSCSIHVKAEIVLPVMLEAKLIGELDIDSHSATPFTPEDEDFLKQVASHCAPAVASHQAKQLA